MYKKIRKYRKEGTLIVSMIMIANFLVKILGLLREILLAQFYGTSLNTDAYIAANNIPVVLFAAIGTSIATTFVPMYARVKEECGEKRANTFAVHMIEGLIAICAFMTLLGEILIREFVFIFVSGFEGQVLELTVSFSRILFPSIFSLALVNIMGAYLQQHSRFLAIVLSPVVGNGIIILSLFAANKIDNIYVLVWGTLIGSLLQIVFYIPCVLKTGILSRDNVSIFKDGHMPLLLRLVVPVFMGESVNEINSIVDRNLVSALDTGSVSALNYAYKIINLVIGVFVAAVGMVAFPKISKLAAENKLNQLRKYGSNIIITIIMVMVPIAMSLIIFRKEIVELLFQRGNFNSRSTLLTGNAMAFYAIGLTGMGVRDILTKLFYSVQNTKTPMINGIICVTINILLDVILINGIGLYGAALATGLTAILSTVLLMIKAKSLGLMESGELYKPCLKIFIAIIIVIVFDLVGKRLADNIFGDMFYIHIFVCGVVGFAGMVIFLIINGLLKNLSIINRI